MTGVDDPVGTGTIVGKEQQPLRIQIQPPHRPDPVATALHQFRRRPSPFFIRKGRYKTSRLMEHEPDPLCFPCQHLSIHCHPVSIRIHLVPYPGGNSIYSHPAGLYVFLRHPPGAYPGGRQKLLQSLFHTPSPRSQPKRGKGGPPLPAAQQFLYLLKQRGPPRIRWNI